jgi:outer membrane lipoprotein carrier protein
MKIQLLVARCVLAFVSTLFAVQASADTDVLARLDAFTMDLKTFTADFDQTLYGADSEVIRSNSGSLLLKRPGKFIWRYEGADTQEFIADGKSIWVYDKDLDQVSVNPLSDRLGGTPLVLLMGGTALDEQFKITALEESDGISWVELLPIDGSADFEALYIGLNQSGLAAMELRDNLGQATQIRFKNFKPGVELDDALFNFVPPKGVDVIGEPAQ